MSREGAGEVVREGEVDFAKPLARALLRDARLSFGARGLFAFLWDLPSGWRPCVAHLSKMGTEGRDAIRARLGELEQVGALRYEAIRDAASGQMRGTRWVLASPTRWAIACPLDRVEKTELRIIRNSANPTFGQSRTKVHLANGSPISAGEPPAADWLPSSTHPLSAAALVDLAASCWRAKPSSNQELDKKHCRQALTACVQITDQQAAAIVVAIACAGGWPKDALAKLKSVGAKFAPMRSEKLVEHNLNSEARLHQRMQKDATAMLAGGAMLARRAKK